MFETSPFSVEWMRFEPDCEIRELIKGLPHVAFEIDDIEHAIAVVRKIFYGFNRISLTRCRRTVKGYELVALRRSDGAAWIQS
jgi:hypothetical protein